MRGRISLRVPAAFLTISAALLSTILWTQPLAAQAPPPFGPEWLPGMTDQGWRKVHDGVLERQVGGSVETFTYGEEGRRFRVRRLRERINALRLEQSAHPSPELAQILATLQSQLVQAEASPIGISSRASSTSSSGSSLGSLSESSVSATQASACEPTLGGQASTGPLTGTGAPGVTANASASYSSCGDLGHTYAYAYARATSGSTTNVRSQEDPKYDGTSLSSTAGANASGGTDCYSEAYARAWSTAAPGGPSYEVQSTNYSCTNAASVTISSPSPGATVGSPFRVTVTENTAAPTALLQLSLDGLQITRDYGVEAVDWSVAAKPGPHTFAVRAWYGDGTSSTAQVSFFVSNPAVTVSTPVDSATYNSPVFLLANENTSRPPATMQYWLDGVAGPAVQGTDSYGKLIDVEPGNHQLTVRASYPDGTSESTTVDFKVRPGTVTITSPANGATVSSPIHLVANEASTLTATAMYVSFDGTHAYYSTSNGEAVDIYINAAPGTHTIYVSAYYADGTDSARSVTVTVP